MDNYMLHVQESVNLTIYLYAQTMKQRRILYIRKFYKHIYISIYIHRWDTGTKLRWRVTNMARKKLKKKKPKKKKKLKKSKKIKKVKN